MARLRQKWLRQWFSDRKEKKIKSAHAPILAPMRLWRPDRNGPDMGTKYSIWGPSWPNCFDMGSVLFKLLRYGVNICDMGSVSFKLLQYGVNSCVTNRKQYIYNRLKTLLTLLEFDS